MLKSQREDSGKLEGRIPGEIQKWEASVAPRDPMTPLQAFSINPVLASGIQVVRMSGAFTYSTLAKARLIEINHT